VAPSAVQATDGTTCNSVQVSWLNSTGATSFDVYRSTSNIFSSASFVGNVVSSPLVDNTPVAGTTYYYWVVSKSSCGNSAPSAPDTGRSGSSAVFTMQPSDLTVDEGQNANFKVIVGGASSYRWYRDGTALSNGGSISGATSNTLFITPATLADAGFYKCFVATPCGSQFSAAARLTVNTVFCAADFNQDGGVDGSDVVDFYAAWESGDASADVNQDGGVDGGDVDTFAALWEAGGC
jgi:hypothetical protein